MSTSPQPPLPPVPPQPPRSGSNVVAIALLVLALIALVSGIAVWTGLRFLSTTSECKLRRGEGVARKFPSIRRSGQLKFIMMSTRTAWVCPSTPAPRR